MDEFKEKTVHLTKKTFNITKHYLCETTEFMKRTLDYYNQKMMQRQRQLDLQKQFFAKQNEQEVARNVMITFAEQMSPAFFNSNYEFLEKISTPENMRLENYRYYDNIWILRYSLAKGCNIPIPPYDLNVLKQKLSQDLDRYMCQLQLNKSVEMIYMNYSMILHNPVIIDISDDNPKRKVYIDIRLS